MKEGGFGKDGVRCLFDCSKVSSDPWAAAARRVRMQRVVTSKEMRSVCVSKSKVENNTDVPKLVWCSLLERNRMGEKSSTWTHFVENYTGVSRLVLLDKGSQTTRSARSLPHHVKNLHTSSEQCCLTVTTSFSGSVSSLLPWLNHPNWSSVLWLHSEGTCFSWHVCFPDNSFCQFVFLSSRGQILTILTRLKSPNAAILPNPWLWLNASFLYLIPLTTECTNWNTPV